ncbi:MAG: chorismate synthase [Bacteroidales bacterium]|nr:chorismate synthase [Bacteroidales bacterium]
MPGNTFGYLFRLTTFGESHGVAIGGVIDGCPAGISIDFEFIQQELNRRKPVYPGSTARKEPDLVEFLSGILNGKTLGTPIGFLVKNLAGQSSDYDDLSLLYRPSHADYTYEKKYGVPVCNGGGRASGRETVARVVAGAIAKLLLKGSNIEIRAFITQVGNIIADADINSAIMSGSLRSPLGFIDEHMEQRVVPLIAEAEKSGDTLGGIITCVIKGTPPGLGEPVFDKLQADLAKAMLSIGSAKAFEYGLGFRAALWRGSDYNDQLTGKDGKVTFLTNHDGGIQGGISNGEDIMFRIGFKPVPSVKMPQSTVNQRGEPAMIKIGGRHDTCHVPRLVVIVESMAALVLADHLLRNSTY